MIDKNYLYSLYLNLSTVVLYIMKGLLSYEIESLFALSLPEVVVSK